MRKFQLTVLAATVMAALMAPAAAASPLHRAEGRTRLLWPLTSGGAAIGSWPFRWRVMRRHFARTKQCPQVTG